MFVLLINEVNPRSFCFVTCFLFIFHTPALPHRDTPHYLLYCIFDKLPWEFAVTICRENLQEFAVAICRENLPQEFAVGICRRNLPWVFCMCKRILFCICEQILFLWKQTIFICEQNFLICEIFFINSVSFC